MLFVFRRIAEIYNLQMKILKRPTTYFIVLLMFNAAPYWIRWMIKLVGLKDKASWFTESPLEERLQSAYEHGALVLLQNLDPEYTSGEVEGIIWHAFKERCTAKMVQRTAISSPFSGQALIIFKTRETAERVMRKLDTGCLMLSNGRPVVGSIGPPPNLSGRQSTFFGHLVIEKIKQREKDAVSTSHCSQPNTIEYEMAMEWCALQTRSEKWWNKLYKQQREELKKLQNNLKQK